MGHVEVGHRWERVAMDLLDMSVTTARGNRYVLVMVDCFSRWTEACPLPDKTAHSVADAFFNQVVCRFGMPIVIHSDQGREFENKIMQELCILCGSHKTRTTPYHPESDWLVERFNRTLLMMLAMFAGIKREDWDDLLPAVMMAYRASVHESTGFRPYRLMFGEECTLPMDIELPKQQSDLPDSITSPPPHFNTLHRYRHILTIQQRCIYGGLDGGGGGSRIRYSIQNVVLIRDSISEKSP